MAVFSEKVLLERAMPEVFAYLSDQRHQAELNPHNFRNYRLISANPVGVGTRSEFLLKTGRFAEQVIIEVTKSEPPTLLIEEGIMKEGNFRLSWHLTPLGENQTELELVCEYHTKGVAGLFGGVIEKAFERIYGRVLANLKQHFAASRANASVN